MQHSTEMSVVVTLKRVLTLYVPVCSMGVTDKDSAQMQNLKSDQFSLFFFKSPFHDVSLLKEDF